MINVHEFEHVLYEFIEERFPDTIVRILHGGDYVEDFILELRQDEKKLVFSPYQLFIKSKNYEDTIENFLAEWEEMLK